MKIIYSIFILLICTTCKSFSQNNADNTIHLTRLPPEGILLDKGWKFQTGDNPEWAKPEYDDSKWQPINPTLDIHDSLPQIPRSGIVWFRLHLAIDSSLNNRLVLLVQQSGASEMYLNGKLIHKFGVFNLNPHKVKAFNPLDKPVSFPVSNTAKQVLAIRYALQPHISYSTHWENKNTALSIIVNTVENGLELYKQKYVRSSEQNYFKVGVLLILGVLYLTFYLFHRGRKVNLYFSIYSFLMAIFWSIGIYGINGLLSMELLYPLSNIQLALMVSAYLLLLMAIYNLLEQKRSWFFNFLLVLGIVSVPCGAYIYGWGWLIFAILFTNLINFDITRISFKSIRNKKKGAWIIAAGGVSFFVFWILFTLQFVGFRSNATFIFFDLAHISIPVAVSIYLGYDFALTNRFLQLKLVEVENLSSEKQQILSAQNETLEKQVTQRTAELQNSLTELKDTQSQLVQREKMASLGELTAGIAHEIQNPLNFMNNFSEVNTELIEELKNELQTDNKEEALSLADDIKENEQKINHHGKRADAIVKGMLQHSRISTGQKEPTDINALADEYLGLAYHGLRAKDNTFNATLQTNFDENIGKVNIIPQDMGRVLLNLFNNAFYAVDEKKKHTDNDYEPIVSASTKKLNDKIEIKVKDNGNGIPQKVLDKIFQPFFTTKPTGQGTGLGLSLAYDIIKAHGGDINVKTKEGEGAEFTIVFENILQ